MNNTNTMFTMTTEVEMPELTGTEKQVDWAGKIREDFIRNEAKKIWDKDGKDFQLYMFQLSKTDRGEDLREAFAGNKNKDFDVLRKAVLKSVDEWAAKKPSARFWIDLHEGYESFVVTDEDVTNIMANNLIKAATA